MKIIIEPEDIADVKVVANDCYSVTLTDDEAKDILEKNRNYAGEVYKWGATDTEVRNDLGKVLKKMGRITHDAN